MMCYQIAVIITESRTLWQSLTYARLWIPFLALCQKNKPKQTGQNQIKLTKPNQLKQIKPNQTKPTKPKKIKANLIKVTKPTKPNQAKLTNKTNQTNQTNKKYSNKAVLWNRVALDTVIDPLMSNGGSMTVFNLILFYTHTRTHKHAHKDRVSCSSAWSGTQDVTENDLELLIFLIPPLECTNYWCVPLYPVYEGLGI